MARPSPRGVRLARIPPVGRGAPRGRPEPYSDRVTQPQQPSPVEPAQVPSAAIALAGTGVWLVALAVVLLVPSLHSGDRSWWPWTCLVGAVLGLLAWLFIRRGRGNFVGA